MLTYRVFYTDFEGYYCSTTVRVYNEDDLCDALREIECFEGHVTGYQRISR